MIYNYIANYNHIYEYNIINLSKVRNKDSNYCNNKPLMSV